MEYFYMKVDKRIQRLPDMEFPRELITSKGMVTEISRIVGSIMVKVKALNGLKTVYPDYFSTPYFLIAEKFHKIFEKYQSDIFFHRVMLVEKEMQTPYFLFIPPEIECENKEETTYERDGSIKCLVLDESKVGGNRIFRVKGMSKTVIVRLDAAESVLRREPNGIWFEPVAVNGGKKDAG